MRRGFAILDFETTGFSPKLGDRLVEVGAAYMTPDLTIHDRFESLINPRRDVGPTHIHGITASDVFDAPTFDDVAPELLELLDGRGNRRYRKGRRNPRNRQGNRSGQSRIAAGPRQQGLSHRIRDCAHRLMTRPRSAVEADLIGHGFVIGKAVTKKTAMLITADTKSQSGKAKRARELGIPVVNEKDGFELLGIG